MKLKNLLAWAAVTCLMLHAPASLAGDATDAGVPGVKVPDSSFTFSPVVEGTQVVHSFVVENRGSAELKIEKVKTG